MDRKNQYLVFACVFFGWLGFVDHALAAGEQVIPGEWLVKVKTTSLSALSLKDRKVRNEKVVSTLVAKALGVSQRGMSASLVNAKYKISAVTMSGTLVKVKLTRETDINNVKAVLGKSSDIAFIEPNYVVKAFDIERQGSTDPMFSEQWDMLNTGQVDGPDGGPGVANADVNVVPAWNAGITGSKGMTVAVIDTGVDWDHPDLNDNIFINQGEAGEFANNGIDDDENGIIDDIHGANFVDASAPNNKSQDDNEHGTHCAGTIGAKGDNGIGIAGVNWNVSILPVKFLSASGSGSSEGAINAILYATKMGVKIMSNSWGGGGFSQAMLEAIEQARDQGILFVAAAGNSRADNDKRPSYPASYNVSNILSVAATDNSDRLASFSNFGKTSVHIAAPGVRILSSVPGGGYERFSGTSMACPHVAGVAALLWSVKRSMKFDQIKARLMQTAVPITSLVGKTVTGRVNAWNAIKKIVSPALEAPDETKFQDFSADISQGEYGPNEKKSWTIDVPGAKWIRLVIDQLSIENGYDFLVVKDAEGGEISRFTGKGSNLVSGATKGGKLTVEFTSDSEYQDKGFSISKAQVIY